MTDNKLQRLSSKEDVILELLASAGELYGLEMVAKSKQLKRGTIYVALSRLEEKGLVSSRVVKPDKGVQGPARRMYQITGTGERVLNAHKLYARALIELSV